MTPAQAIEKSRRLRVRADNHNKPAKDRALDAVFECTIERDGCVNSAGHIMRQESTYFWFDMLLESILKGPSA